MVKQLFFENPHGHSFPYELYLPDGYDPSEKYPLIVFLHGAGERGKADGSEIELLDRYFYFGRAKQGESFEAIMAAPQCPTEDYWGCYIESLNRFLDHILDSYSADVSRVSLTGLSMGGTGTWLWALANTERFSCIAPVCGTGVCWYTQKLAHTPVWMFHGDLDDIVPPEESLSQIKILSRLGANAKLTLLHGVGHWAWDYAYAGRELFDWLIHWTKDPAAESDG